MLKPASWCTLAFRLAVGRHNLRATLAPDVGLRYAGSDGRQLDLEKIAECVRRRADYNFVDSPGKPGYGGCYAISRARILQCVPSAGSLGVGALASAHPTLISGQFGVGPPLPAVPPR